MGAYTDIVDIVAPDSAAQGERVDVTVKIKNIDTTYWHLIACVAIVDGLRFIDEAVIIPSGETYSYAGAFLMGGGDVTIYAYSYYPYYEEWILDDQAQKDVDLIAVPESEFRNISIYSIEPSEVEVGDTVRITARVEHRGVADVATIYAAIGVQNAWFNEKLDGEKPWSFSESTTWKTFHPYADIYISAIDPGVYDAYIKIKAPLLVSPTVHNCVTVVGVPTEPEFRGFGVREYTKV